MKQYLPFVVLIAITLLTTLYDSKKSSHRLEPSVEPLGSVTESVDQDYPAENMAEQAENQEQAEQPQEETVEAPKITFDPMNVVVPNNFSTIEEAYKNVKEGGIITIHPGRYTFSSTLVVNSNVTFRGSSGRAEDVVIACPTADAFKITDCSPIFQNLSVISKGDYSGSFVITGGEPKFFGCIFTSLYGYGIVVQGENSNPQVESCALKFCGMSGALVFKSGLGSFKNCEFYRNGTGITVHTSGNPTVTECKIHEGENGGVNVSGAGSAFNNCQIYENKSDGIAVSSSGNPSFTGCDIYKNFSGIDIKTSGNPTVSDCKIHNGGFCGVTIKEKGLGSFNNCEIYGNKPAGIWVESGNPTVTGCIIREGYWGVFIHTNSLGTFKDCKIYGNSLSGIDISSSNPTITECDIYENMRAGIKVSESENLNVTGCKIHDNQGVGILVQDRGAGTFDNNSLSNNYSGGDLSNWNIMNNAGEVKGSGNVPPIPAR